MKVKIYGAGSIGNHLAQASRRMDWDVVVVDLDKEALERMKSDIYPTRYGSWDERITLVTPDQEPKGGFDLICIGTPPDVHLPLALRALDEKPKILHIEKPLCKPKDQDFESFVRKAQKSETKVVVGYDHTVSKGFEYVLTLLKQGVIGDVETIDTEFRFHWQPILDAHPWLSGPQDTYLGFWEKGGGASGEHSHGLHLWLVLAEAAGIGKPTTCSAFMQLVDTKNVSYDAVFALNLATEKNRVGRVMQDVVTLPPRKWARIQGGNGFIEWYCEGRADGDLVRHQIKDGGVKEKIFPKKRPDDFYQEMLHIQGLFDGSIEYATSPIRLDHGLTVMTILYKAHENRNKTFNL